MEVLVTTMITWIRGTTTKLTDFRVGSRIRTVLEAIAKVIEEQTDKLYRAIKELIESNIYAVLGFDKIPATYATGSVSLSRATAADKNYTIPAGTTILSKATQYAAPLKFSTTADAVLIIGTTSVDVPAICNTAGTVGNVAANSITTFLQRPTGIDNVTNAAKFDTGVDEETSEAQKARFQEFIGAQSRGVLQSISLGAKYAVITDPTTGRITEKVTQAKATEDLVNKLGQVDLYVWNGVDGASEALMTAIDLKLTGYYDANGNPVYGYKPAGILVNKHIAGVHYVVLKLVLTLESWASLDDAMKAVIEAEINAYFSKLKLTQTLVQSTLQSNVGKISGISDIKLYISVDNGVTFTMDNVTVGDTELVVLKLPIIYA
jgi:uncharacterized phage protein gp47/JayE